VECIDSSKPIFYPLSEYLDYQIPVTRQMGPKGNGDMQAVKRN